MNLKKLSGIAIPVIVFGALARIIYTHTSKEIGSTLLSSPAPFLLACVLSGANSLAGFFSWVLLVRIQSPHKRLKELYQPYAVSMLSKYLPLGKALQYLSFAADGGEKTEKGNYGYSLFLSTVIGVAAGGVIALAGGSMLLSQIKLSTNTVVTLLVALAVILAFGQKLIRHTFVKLGVMRKQSGTPSLKMVTTVFLIQLIFCWLPEGIGAISLLGAIKVHVTLSSFTHLMASYAIASLVGYLSLLTPGGIGVREAVLTILLQPTFSPPAAAFISIGLRLATIGGDLFFSLPLVVTMIKRFGGLRQPQRNIS